MRFSKPERLTGKRLREALQSATRDATLDRLFVWEQYAGGPAYEIYRLENGGILQVTRIGGPPVGWRWKCKEDAQEDWARKSRQSHEGHVLEGLFDRSSFSRDRRASAIEEMHRLLGLDDFGGQVDFREVRTVTQAIKGLPHSALTEPEILRGVILIVGESVQRKIGGNWGYTVDEGNVIVPHLELDTGKRIAFWEPFIDDLYAACRLSLTTAIKLAANSKDY